eukprot:2149918-Amphidinium_carterae.1
MEKGGFAQRVVRLSGCFAGCAPPWAVMGVSGKEVTPTVVGEFQSTQDDRTIYFGTASTDDEEFEGNGIRTSKYT